METGAQEKRRRSCNTKHRTVEEEDQGARILKENRRCSLYYIIYIGAEGKQKLLYYVIYIRKERKQEQRMRKEMQNKKTGEEKRESNSP